MLNSILFLAIGIISWTFLEYIIHRFLGHQKNGKHIIKKEHQRHHAEVNYFVPIVKKIGLAMVVLFISTLITGLIFNLKDGFLFSFGLASMYFIYETAHKLFHIKEPIIRYGLRMRKHHFYHHFGNPKFNHGVTTAFWDRIFGTFHKVDIVIVPRKMPLVWLQDQNKNLKTKYSNHFKIV